MYKKILHAHHAPLFLFAALVFLLLFGPILNRWEVVCILFLGITTRIFVHKNVKKYAFSFIASLFVSLSLIFLGYWFHFLTTQDHQEISALALHFGIIAFLGLYAIESLKEMMSTKKASIGEIVSAINTYLIVGFIFGELYVLINFFQKHAFDISEKILFFRPHLSPLKDSWPYLYFSFMTQTTIGYGDITPISHLAQVISIFQGIFGPFYITIVLAYLLHNYISINSLVKK